ncbi:hypothetical protein [Pseudolabrys sp. FHR47]|uniref:COG3904 family protein n=1 Tax=Pseudolabrys sp. FHR47 TaxID=2562284 RepID=UPI0010BEC2E7|nr:hypothetical protein [Pseudolabrys sp. FHR47]
MRVLFIVLWMVVISSGVARAANITALPLKGQDGLILIEGEIKYEDKEAFLAKVTPFSGGIVVLKSPGGSAYAGIEIGKAIRMRGFTTWVESGTVCSSACAIAWLGGVRRLMGRAAVIGFHAIYKVERGEPVETGVGNAMYGAYLAQLGLPDTAIMYLSNAAPTSMNWLTPADAEAIGIKLSVFDLDSKAPPAAPPIAALPAPAPPLSLAPGSAHPPSGQYSATLDGRARDFVIALNVLLSGSNEQYVKLLDGIYADQVVYYGKQLPRSEVVAQLVKFVERWPDRSYVVRPDSLSVQCDALSHACQVTGTIDFSAKSAARNQWSRGAATFDYLLAFRPTQKYPVIANESGAVLDRQMSVLQPSPSRYPNNFDPSR